MQELFDQIHLAVIVHVHVQLYIHLAVIVHVHVQLYNVHEYDDVV